MKQSIKTFHFEPNLEKGSKYLKAPYRGLTLILERPRGIVAGGAQLQRAELLSAVAAHPGAQLWSRHT